MSVDFEAAPFIARVAAPEHALWRAPAGALPVGAAISSSPPVCRFAFGPFGDVSWMIAICEGWLDGKRPYTDFLETNPPGAILVYMPPTMLARALHWRAEFVVAAYGLGLATAAWASSLAILKRAGLMPARAPIFAAVGLVGLAVLPGRTLDERDFFALVLGLPFVALAAARAANARPRPFEVALAGLGLGLMVAVKPFYATIPALLIAYLVARLGWAAALICEEYAIGATLAAAYAAFCWFAFPAYFADVLPLARLASTAGPRIVDDVDRQRGTCRNRDAWRRCRLRQRPAYFRAADRGLLAGFGRRVDRLLRPGQGLALSRVSRYCADDDRLRGYACSGARAMSRRSRWRAASLWRHSLAR